MRRLGKDEQIVTFSGETKVGDPQNWCADISLLKKIGYKKQKELEAGVFDYVNWVRAEG